MVHAGEFSEKSQDFAKLPYPSFPQLKIPSAGSRGGSGTVSGGDLN
jgi:hypothetical protein